MLVATPNLFHTKEEEEDFLRFSVLKSISCCGRLLLSIMTGTAPVSRWIPNRATLAVSSNVCPENEASQFAAISPPAEGEGSATTFDSQPVQVFLFPCSNGRSFYMYMGDRWNFNGPGSVSPTPGPSCTYVALLAQNDIGFICLYIDYVMFLCLYIDIGFIYGLI